MKNLYFVRHGLSELGKAGLWAGSTDSPLAPEGHEQAKAAGVVARDLGINYIIASPLSRAYDTARYIAEAVAYPIDQIEINRLVIERNFGPLEGTAWDPVFDVDSIAEAESSTSVLLRARQTYDYLQSLPYDTILVVSHGSFGRALRHVIQPEVAFDSAQRFQNAEIVQLI